MHKDSVKECTSAISVPWPWIRCVRSIIETSRDPVKYYKTDLPVELSSWLYLSDEQNALDHKKLLNLGITHVLSLNGVTPYKDEWSRDLYQRKGIVHKRVHGEDEEGYDMIGEHWEECYRFLQSVISDPKNKVVVHCVAGINRSGLIACAAYMIFEGPGVNVLDSVRHCLDKRGNFLWNRSFQKQLCCLAAQHDLLGERPPGYSDEPMEEKRLSLPPPPITALDRLLR